MKVGDSAYIVSDSEKYSDYNGLVTVEKVGRKYIVVADKNRNTITFDKDTGAEKYSWRYLHIYESEDAYKQYVTTKQLKQRIINFLQHNDVPLTTLEQVAQSVGLTD